MLNYVIRVKFRGWIGLEMTLDQDLTSARIVPQDELFAKSDILTVSLAWSMPHAT